MSFKSNVSFKWEGDIVKFKGKQIINKSIWEAGLIVEGQAKELCARRYGYLAASINTQTKDQGDDVESPAKYSEEQITVIGGDVPSFKKLDSPIEENVAHIGTNVDYSYYVEFGTTKMSAQPFLRPALDLSKGKTLTILKINSKYYFGDYLNIRDIFLMK